MGAFRRAISSLLVATVFNSACASKALWEATDPNKYVRISQDEITEAELTRQGRDYRRNDEKHVYFAEKTRLEKAGDYAARVVGLPFTALADVTGFYAVLLVVLYLPVGPESVQEEDGVPGWSGCSNR